MDKSLLKYFEKPTSNDLELPNGYNIEWSYECICIEKTFQNFCHEKNYKILHQDKRRRFQCG